MATLREVDCFAYDRAYDLHPNPVSYPKAHQCTYSSYLLLLWYLLFRGFLRCRLVFCSADQAVPEKHGTGQWLYLFVKAFVVCVVLL